MCVKMVGFLESFFLPGYMDWGKLRSKNKKEWNQWLAILTKKAWSKRICLPFFCESKHSRDSWVMNTTFTSFFYLVKPQTVAKMLRHSNEEPAFLYFKSLPVTRLWYIIMTCPPPLPFSSIQSCSTKYGLVLLATLIRGGGRDHKHKIMDRPFKQKWGTVSQVFLQLIAAL